MTSLKVLNCRAKEKDFILSFFAKSPVYEDLKRLHAKTGHGSFVKLKTALTAAKKWQPGFDEKLTQIIKRCKLCPHHSDIIDTEVDQLNDVIKVEIIDGAEDILRSNSNSNSSKHGHTHGNKHLLLPLGYWTKW